jgi:hypothetical protein
MRDLQTELESRDEQRSVRVDRACSVRWRLRWPRSGSRQAPARANRQQEICDTLEQTAHDISAQSQAHASETIAEISRLVQAASEAPKAAAEVVAELRQKLSDSMVRDTAMLEERSRLLATLETLLDAVNHASTEQRSAVDALVATSADLLERVGTQFTDKVEAETGKLGAVAAQVTGSAVEVASLGEAFGMRPCRCSASRTTSWCSSAAYRNRAGQVARTQRRTACLLRGAGSGSDRSEHDVAEADRRGPAAARRSARIRRSRRGMSEDIDGGAEVDRADMARLRRPDVGLAGRVRADPRMCDRRAARALDPARTGGQAAADGNAAPQDPRAGAWRGRWLRAA